jgi:hypothetical protein
MAFKIEQLLLNGSENSVTLIGKTNTIYYVKVARTKIMELEAKVETSRNRSPLERQAFVEIKAIILI